MAILNRFSNHRALAALQHRNYRWYFASGMGMSAAQGIQDLALTWLVLDLSDSLATLGLVIFVRGITMLVLGLFGGAFADRYSRKNLLIANQALTLVNMTAIATLIFAGAVELWQVYASSVMLGLTQAMTSPARTALIRSLVPREDMLNAVALNSFQMNLSRIIWPTIAGGLIALTGTGAAFAICAVASVFGIVFILPVRDAIDNFGGGRKTTAFEDIVDGLRYIRSVTTLAMIMGLIMCVGMFGLTFQLLAAAFAREEMHFSADETGFFLMAAGIGSILGSALLLTGEVKNRNLRFMQSVFGFGAAVLLVAINPTVAGAFLLMGVFGLFNGTTPVLAQTIFQVGVPQRYLGRVNSLFSIAPGLAAMISLPLGLLGEVLSLRVSLATTATILMIAPLLAAAAGLHRRELAEAEPDEPVEAPRAGTGIGATSGSRTL